MRMRRQAGALVLYGGWLLLFNPQAHQPFAPLGRWKKVGEYDSSYLCQQARGKSVLGLLYDQQKSPGGPSVAPGTADLRYRCERTERVDALKR